MHVGLRYFTLLPSIAPIKNDLFVIHIAFIESSSIIREGFFQVIVKRMPLVDEVHLIPLGKYRIFAIYVSPSVLYLRS